MSDFILETSRLRGRRVEPDDLDAMHAVYGDADAMRWVGEGRALTRAECEKWIEKTQRNYALRGYGMFTLIERESGRVIGFCGLVHPAEQVEAEIKYALAREYWGRGFATEAAAALLAYGARVHGLNSVMATAAPAHVASHRVLLKAGLQAGELRRNDDGSDTQLFGWRAAGAKREPGPSDIPALFDLAGYRAVEWGAAQVPLLQAFFEHNPEYYYTVGDQAPSPTEADEEVNGPLPPGWPYTKKWIIAFLDDAGACAGVANVVSDLLVPGVWHIGLMVVATRLHGTGAAQAMYAGLEGWVRDSGALWLRLGVVEGNTRAERFWARCGYVQLRERAGIEMGARVNTVLVMAKSLAGQALDDYLALVPRDRPDAP